MRRGRGRGRGKGREGVAEEKREGEALMETVRRRVSKSPLCFAPSLGEARFANPALATPVQTKINKNKN